ncbi:MAG TPA: Hpt domain-containing protein [Rhodospirillales bacterium]|jgi:HPt (histidine-containing phosphotransfer) domain-containing protein|nr:Hpt domain-containing protein [Rhodospirillales bacterium]
MTDPNQQLQDQIKALRDEYESLLPERLDELDSAFADIPDDIRDAAARQALETLYALAHKLTGSAGTFGFMTISQAAERLEAHCQSLLENAADGTAAGGRETIAGLVAAVRDAAGQDAG